MKLNRKLLGLCLIQTLAWFGLGACNSGPTVEAAREDRPAMVSTAEQDFMRKAAQANLAEIDISRIALQKSDNTDVRDYATMVKNDHNGALADLVDLMKDHNVPQPTTLAADTKQDISRMNALTGPEFDREFVNMMVADHRKAVEMFREQSTTAQTPDLHQYVEQVRPKLEMHLDKAQRLQSQLFSGPPK